VFDSRPPNILIHIRRINAVVTKFPKTVVNPNVPPSVFLAADVETEDSHKTYYTDKDAMIWVVEYKAGSVPQRCKLSELCSITGSTAYDLDNMQEEVTGRFWRG
jgi:hypothetical protein